MHVRLATPEDLPGIIKDYGGNESNPLNPFASVERLKQLPGEGLLVAEVEGVYAGFLYWFKATKPRGDSAVKAYAQIAEIHIKRAFWKTKVGLALLARALKDIEKLEIPEVYINVEGANAQLQDACERAGFSTFERTSHMRFLYPLDRRKTNRSREEAIELAVFLVEAREQCRMFSTAYEEIMELIRKGPPSDEDGQRVFNARIWLRLQAALAACAVVSKILWPQLKRRRDGSDKVVVRRGDDLRQFLKLRGLKPLPVAVRNSFEHIDEKIDEWLPSQKGDDMPWGWSLSAIEGPEPKGSMQALRYFNVFTTELRVANARCILSDVARQIKQIESSIPQDGQIHFRQSEDSGS